MLAYGLLLLLAQLLVGSAGFETEPTGSGCSYVSEEDVPRLDWRLWIVALAAGTWTALGLVLLSRSTRWLSARRRVASALRGGSIALAVWWTFFAVLAVVAHSGFLAAIYWGFGLVITLATVLITAAVAVVVGRRETPTGPAAGGPGSAWLWLAWLVVPVGTFGGGAWLLLTGPLSSVLEVSSC